MTTAPTTQEPVPAAPPKQPKSTANRIFTTLWAIIVACVVVAIAVYFLVFRGVIGEPADLRTSERVTTVFVAALAANQADEAYSQMASQAQEQSSLDDVKALSEELSQAGYTTLRMCEFQVSFGSIGKQLIGVGLLRHAQGLVAIQSTLLQQSDGSWKVLGFNFLPTASIQPWGACQADPP